MINMNAAGFGNAISDVIRKVKSRAAEESSSMGLKKNPKGDSGGEDRSQALDRESRKFRTIGSLDERASKERKPVGISRLNAAYGNFEDNKESEERAEKKESEDKSKKLAEEAESPTDFYADFNTYSKNNLDGMGLYDFMVVEDTDEDRDAWRNFVQDETIKKYYEDALEEAGGFDAWYDSMIADDLDSVLSGGQSMHEKHFGADDEAVQAIMNELAYQGYIPSVTGDQNQIDQIQSALAQDYQAAADLMAYNYALNMIGGAKNAGISPEDLRGYLTLDEANALTDYGNMQYGYGDGYDMSADPSKIATFETVDAINPEDWSKSIKARNTSRPGYGLADQGQMRAAMNWGYDAGFKEQDYVPGLWDDYYGNREE